MVIVYSGELLRSTISSAKAKLWKALDETDDVVVVSLAEVSKLDSAGVALLSLLGRELERRGKELRLVEAKPHIRATLQLFPCEDNIPKPVEYSEPAERSADFLVRIGRRGQVWVESFICLLSILVDTGYFTIQGLLRPHTICWRTLTYSMSSLGAQAIGVVVTVSLLVGATMALQSAAQLRQFGASIFVVDLIGISMTRELGPLMAAVVVSGRSGSAVAAEIATMAINEEIDALKTMGIQPVRFLVVPKMLAIGVTQPLLTVIANIAGIFGGFIVAFVYLDIAPMSFLGRLQQSIFIEDVFVGLAKAFIFAEIIVVVGVYYGFRTRGGADAVGRATTASVVGSIFWIIFADAILSLGFSQR